MQSREGGKYGRKPIAHGTANGFRQHERRGSAPPAGTCGCREAYNAAARNRRSVPRHGDCTACEKRDVAVRRHDDLDYCKACYQRWQQTGFDGGEPPPPQQSALERAIEHREILASYPAASAAWRIGVSVETARRYARLLKEEDHREATQ